jgi:hypothetical protein
MAERPWRGTARNKIAGAKPAMKLRCCLSRLLIPILVDQAHQRPFVVLDFFIAGEGAVFHVIGEKIHLDTGAHQCERNHDGVVAVLLVLTLCDCNPGKEITALRKRATI